MTTLERALLPLVQVKHPTAVSVWLPNGNGADSWCRAYTDPRNLGFYIVYLHEVVPPSRFAEFGLTSHPSPQDSLPYTV